MRLRTSSVLLQTSVLALCAAGAAPAFAQTAAPVSAPQTQQGSATPALPTEQAPYQTNPATPGQPTTPQGAPVAADAAPADAAPAAAPADIVVTGSRIARPTLDSTIPVTTLTAAELTRTGSISVGDVLNDLPSIRSTYSQANSTQFIGTTGVNYLDLRGLGVTRTLVLVNGRRHITSSAGDFLVDTNTIPTDLLDRVDVVTGGSSAVYGSDAMAGVVNFVLKRNFSGASLNAQAGLTDRGGKGTQRISGTFGQNFADGRGNIALNLEYNNTELVTFADRGDLTGAFTGRNQFQQVDNPSLDNTVPDRTFLSGVRSYGYDNGGNFVAYNGTSLRNCSGGVAAACLANGFPRIYGFNSDGSLSEYNYGRDFRPAGSNNNQGGSGGILNDRGTLNPSLQRYVANVIGHFDVSEAFKPFIEAKFVRVDAFSQGTPTFGQGGEQGAGADAGTYLGSGVPIFFDNAYLQPGAAATIRSQLPAGATFFRLNRNNNDLGTRDEFDRRDTYRFVGGVEGTFNDDWKYDVSVNYGEFHSNSIFYNNRIESRFQKAADAVRNGAGQIVCRVNQASVTDPSCVPINLFGDGAPSQAALNYVNTTSTSRSKATELDINANLVGDSSQLFELPGGPVKFAIGGEYRRETAFQAYDDTIKGGDTFFNAIPDFAPPSFEVKEAYGEIELPLLKNLPFAQELTVNGAGRVADYKGSTGTVFAYNAGVIYAPIRDVKFRVNYSRSVRAPTLSDLYASNSQNFDLLNDPCDVNYINKGRSTRVANCAAAGVPAGFVNDIARAGSTEFLSGGNPNLSAETSRSWTFGAIFQPRYLPGLSITADWYDVKISNIISAVGAQTILDACYDGTSLDNQFCRLINPRQANGTFARPALLQATVNYSARDARGLDLDVAYNHAFDGSNKLALRFVGTYVDTRTDYPYLDTPDRPERIKGELGDPVYNFNVSADYTHKNVTLGYQLRYIGRQTVTDWESSFTTYGVAPLDPYYADRTFYPSVVYHAIRATVEVNKQFRLYGGVDNLTDKKPPYGQLGISDGGAIYDNVGRYMYVGASVKL